MKFVKMMAMISVVCHLMTACTDRVDNMDALMKAYADQDLFSGTVLVAKGDELLYQSASGWADRSDSIPSGVNTGFRIGSLTKPFTAHVIQRLITEGYLRLDDTLGTVFPTYRGEGRDQITVRELIQHTSGIIAHLSDETESVIEQNHHTLDELVSYAESAPLGFVPGTAFQYSNYGYAVLAKVAEKVTGQAYSDVLKQYLLIPGGLNHTQGADMDSYLKNASLGYEYDLLEGYKNANPIDLSYARGYGDITSTTHDLWKWIRYQKSYRLPATEDDSISSVTTWGWFNNKIVTGVNADTIEVLEHSGSINGFGSFMLYVPEDQLTVIVLKNFRSNNYLQPIYASSIGKQLLSCYYEDLVELPRKSVAMTLARKIGEGLDIDESYTNLKLQERQHLKFDESELNKLGIELLFKYNSPYQAAEVFRINMEEYPRSYNTYDSYAFALLMCKDTSSAVAFYKKGFSVFDQYPEENDIESVHTNLSDAKSFIRNLEISIP